MDANTTGAVEPATVAADLAGAVEAGKATADAIGAETSTLGKVTSGIDGAAQTAEAAFGLLKDLHVVNAKLADHGTSIAELISVFAKVFHGIHI